VLDLRCEYEQTDYGISEAGFEQLRRFLPEMKFWFMGY
jgi:hypothetical protein